jgi:hypothetical protein
MIRKHATLIPRRRSLRGRTQCFGIADTREGRVGGLVTQHATRWGLLCGRHIVLIPSRKVLLRQWCRQCRETVLRESTACARASDAAEFVYDVAFKCFLPFLKKTKHRAKEVVYLAIIYQSKTTRDDRFMTVKANVRTQIKRKEVRRVSVCWWVVGVFCKAAPAGPLL